MVAVTGGTRADTRSRIVNAAERLMRDGGRDAVTTRAVSDAAGVQPPTIYRLFGDKDGLLDAVAERVLQTYVTTKVEASGSAGSDDADPVVALRDAWDRQIDFGLANPEVFALLSDPARSSPASEAGMRVLAERIRRIAAVGRLRVGEERATDLVHAAGTGVILALLGTPPTRRDRTLADAMYETVAARILVDEAVPPTVGADSVLAAARRLGSLSDGEVGLLREWLRRG